MKKVTSHQGSPSVKKPIKAREEGELKKPTKLKPLKEKEKKGWKTKLVEEEDDFLIEDELKLDNDFDDEEDDDVFYDDEY